MGYKSLDKLLKKNFIESNHKKSQLVILKKSIRPPVALNKINKKIK